MTRLLILADDLTGALDTGVQFAKRGIRTKTICDFRNLQFPEENDYPVIVINTESRHCNSKQAYERVYHICKMALKEQFDTFYKKTDSGLRGNIGSEISAVMDAIQCPYAYFLPAYPDAKRTTRKGIHLWNETPIHLTAFGKDRLNPVPTSNVSQLLKSQCEKTTYLNTDLNRASEIMPGIHIFDAETNEDLAYYRERLKTINPKILAGCAGFANQIPDLFSIIQNIEPVELQFSRLLIISGSIHSVTQKQLAYAKEHGIPSRFLLPSEKLGNYSLWDCKTEENEDIPKLKEWKSILYGPSHTLLLHTLDQKKDETIDYAADCHISKADIHKYISENLAHITKQLLNNYLNETVEEKNKTALFVIGGDTLSAIVRHLQVQEIIPHKEIGEGTVLSKITLPSGQTFPLITKSGGFGQENIITNISHKYMTS